MKGTMSMCILVVSCSLALSLVAGCDADVAGPEVPDSASRFATSDVGRSDTGTSSSADSGGPTSDGGATVGCQTNEDCVDQVAIGPCQAVTCMTSTGLCSVTPVPDSTPCGEDDLCLSAGACAQGLCIGQPAKCDDGNPCTDGSCKPDRGCVYLDNTAPCDDEDLCTTGDTCAGGKCVGTLVSGCGGGCGDGSCADGEDCTSCAADCGPCSTSGCSDDEVANCEGGCSPSAKVGDGACDLELDCAATGNDGGDCAQVGACGDSQIEGCGGVCLEPLAFAEMLSNTTCDAELNCSTYDFDAGSCTTGSGCEASDFPCADGDGCISTLLVCDDSSDCADGSDEASCVAPGTCPAGKAPGCNDTCYTASWFGDGVCDSFLDCEATSWDGGDCEQTTGGGGSTTECDAGEQLVCAGTYCLPSTWLGDGTCDAPMDCADTGWDGGDCEQTTGGGGGDLECPDEKQPNCSGSYCYTSAWIGDGTCDSFFDCSSTGWDGGDCL
jgi:hypothetical protein